MKYLLGITLCLTIAMQAMSQCEEMVPVGDWGTGEYSNVAILGNLAYCAAWGNGLDVINVSDPANPIRVFNLDMPQLVLDLETDGDYLYLANWWMGLTVFDISNPMEPFQVGGIAMPGTDILEKKDDFVYIAGNDPEFRVVDVSDPFSPTFGASVPLPNLANSMTLEGDLLIVGTFQGAAVFDISNPGTPVQLSTLNDRADAVSMEGNVAVQLNDRFLETFDITNPATPIPLGMIDLSLDIFNQRGLQYDADTNLALVGNRDVGLMVVDLSDPSNPQLVINHPLEGEAYGMEFVGDRVHIASVFGGLEIVDLAQPADPKTLGSFNQSGIAVKMADTDTIAVVGYQKGPASPTTGRVRIFDRNSPTEPELLSQFDTKEPLGMALWGDYLYVSNGVTDIYNIADPANPALERVAPFFFRDMVNVGNLAYTVSFNDLHVLDMTDFSAPTILNSQPLSLGVAAAASKDLLFVFTFDDGLEVYSLADPLNPSLVAAQAFNGNILDMDVVGDHLYLATNNGVEVRDFSDPANLTIVGGLNVGETRSLEFHKSEPLMFAGSTNLVSIVDISDPINPQTLELIQVADAPSALGFRGDTLTVAMSQAGILGTYSYLSTGTALMIDWPQSTITDLVQTVNDGCFP